MLYLIHFARLFAKCDLLGMNLQTDFLYDYWKIAAEMQYIMMIYLTISINY